VSSAIAQFPAPKTKAAVLTIRDLTGIADREAQMLMVEFPAGVVSAQHRPTSIPYRATPARRSPRKSSYSS